MTSRGSKFADASQCRWFRTSVREIYSSQLPISRRARSCWICSTTAQVCQTCFKACNTDELIANTNAANVPCHISTLLYTVELPTARFFDLVYCSSQPSMVHWLSSSIFPCLFVRPAIVTSDQISLLPAPDPQTHTFSESL